MIVLRDTIKIKTTPEEVFEWFAQFKENYRAWHPDHGECRYLHGSHPFEEGAIIYAEEYLHGDLHKLKLHMSRVVPNSRMEYKIPLLGSGAFIIEPSGDDILFTAELHLGWRFPVIGSLIDWVFQTFFGHRLNAMRQHMREEGINLKELMEKKSSQDL
ncbi:MAG: SRPBCC family protein [Candidatus Hodarchaeota archaeon]